METPHRSTARTASFTSFLPQALLLTCLVLPIGATSSYSSDVPTSFPSFSRSSVLDNWNVDDPLDYGLESLPQSDLNLVLLRQELRLAQQNCQRRLCSSSSPGFPPLTYSIFASGKSALRSIGKHDQHLIQPARLFAIDPDQVRPHHTNVCATLLFLRGYGDAAHEVLLGVTYDNMEQAEYAATNRGQTNWTETHPLDDTADMLHAALHRLVEGSKKGEGGHTGWDNARYWYAGGPKRRSTLAPHPVRTRLAQIAPLLAPTSVTRGGVIADQAVEHRVLSSGDSSGFRTVQVAGGEWDDFAYVNLCEQWCAGTLDEGLSQEVALLQRAELLLLLRHELLEC